MTGATHAAPSGHCHHRRDPRGRAFFPELLAMMGGGRGPGGPGFGFGPGPHGRGGRGRRARRGDIRAASLLLLAEEPRNGYGLMQVLEERSGGVWRPSPGSVYPALAQLEDEGLIRSVEHDGRKTFELTDEGRAHVEEHRERYGTPWETVAEGVPSELHDLRHAGQALAVASMQVAQMGSKAQLAEAKRILEDARRGLYRLLAGDAPEGDQPTGEDQQ
ncbi:MAG TPA: PadR family transcriptional regulator [Baekduia sp.]|uniref:PadR family transcriptional regulator n=1 Tax=Baekduia sp. TaxID=2600305 RepID=UPI002BBE8F94|nr:PadR family transcriptional regulator [Baekduia sp.]HMJ34416.1 PadR family transcriptional regulator [Baekduia sp.]